ncbi:tyrosine-type recombinase/integrase [Thalassotalea profundi]|uniref:Phage-related integrase n=1 Tax=Thalassotalea profundi TaxID=2036687 RepID=A0ABQ3J042_9GAMM|nr:site-specific integrase [Thalassotalea profundi]GHE96776.1 phage-related integrase [Thalassotalea profundi]
MTILQTKNRVATLVENGAPLFETVYPSLYIDIKEPGVASWIFRYQLYGKRRQFKIGSYGKGHQELLDVEEAIKLAIDFRMKINDGIDPKLDIERQKRPKLITFDDWANKFIENKRSKIKSADIYERIYKNEIKTHIGNIRIDRIHSYDIDHVLLTAVKSGRPAVANQVLLFIKRVFRLATKYGAVLSNIAAEFSQSEDAGGAERKRQRYLEENEIEQVFAVFRAHPLKIPTASYIALVLLLALGMRKMELMSAKWSQIDFKRQTFRLIEDNTKTEAALVLPIPDLVMPLMYDLKVLAGHSDYLFPRRKKSALPHVSPDTLNNAIATLFGNAYGNRKAEPNHLGEAGVDHFTVHDLRRTFRTLLSKLGVRKDVAEKCMNHSLKGVEKTYDCYAFFPERKDALNQLAELIMPLVQYSPLLTDLKD